MFCFTNELNHSTIPQAQNAHSPEMVTGTFNAPCPHLRARTAFDMTRNSPADKALRNRLRRCRLPSVTAVCEKQRDGLIVCTFKPERPPAYSQN